MTYFLQQPGQRSRTADRLDNIRMTEGERTRAKAYLQQGEDFADFVLALAYDVRRFIGAVRKGAVGLAWGLKALLVNARSRRAARDRRRRARARRAGAT